MESLGLKVVSVLRWTRHLTRASVGPRARAISFFQLAFDGSIADMFLLKDAISIDGKGVRDGMHRKHRRHRAGETAIAILRPGHLVLGNELFPFLLVVIETHAKNHQRLTLKFPGDIANMR